MINNKNEKEQPCIYVVYLLSNQNEGLIQFLFSVITFDRYWLEGHYH